MQLFSVGTAGAGNANVVRTPNAVLHRNIGIDMCMDMGMDMCIDMCMDMCMDMCPDLCMSMY